MTKQNPFDLAIFALKRERDKAVIDDPCPICSYEAAMRLLEAAGKVDKKEARECLDVSDERQAWMGMYCWYNQIDTLLSALPEVTP